MLIREAKDLAGRWVRQEAAVLPGFHGAYFAGSTIWIADDAHLPSTSDLDVNLIWTNGRAPDRSERLLHQGAHLHITHLSLQQLQSPERVLSHYHLAGGFRAPAIILDPSGRLTELQTTVQRDYAKRYWVRRRCEHARTRVLEGLSMLDEPAPLHDQAISWLFPTGVTTHILLAAGLQNPTVRRRYLAVRQLLEAYGYLPFYESLLDLLGCASLSRSRVEQHLENLAGAFDLAKSVIKTLLPFASDISDLARPLAIDGSRELIEQGSHREAVFWIAVTYSRCRKVLELDAPEMRHRFDPGYFDLLSDLGIASPSALQRRSEHVRSHLDQIWDIAEAIVDANPEIEAQDLSQKAGQ